MEETPWYGIDTTPLGDFLFYFIAGCVIILFLWLVFKKVK